MRIALLFKAGQLVFAIGTIATAAMAQVTAPPNSRVFDDSGTFEAIHGEIVQIRDSKSEPWLLKIIPETKIVIDGAAEREHLRPGVFVQFECKIDKNNAVKEPLEEIAITSAQSKASLGLFPSDDKEGLAQSVRVPSAGSYVIKGKLVSLRDGEFLVMAGRHKITGTFDEEKLKVKLSLDDISLAQQGDAVKVKAWYYDAGRPAPGLGRAGNAIADEITVTLSKPLATVGKKPRQFERPVRATSKSKVAK